MFNKPPSQFLDGSECLRAYFKGRICGNISQIKIGEASLVFAILHGLTQGL